MHIIKLKCVLTTLGSVGKGVIGGGTGGAVAPGVGGGVVGTCADTIAMEAEPIRMDVIESFIFD